MDERTDKEETNGEPQLPILIRCTLQQTRLCARPSSLRA